MIEVIQGQEAPDNLLTTLTKVKGNLGISDTTNDVILGEIIQEVSDFVPNYCGRIFAQETVKESLIGRGLPNLVLSRTPLITVTQVEHSGDVVDANSYSVYDDKAGILQMANGWRSSMFSLPTIDAFPSSYGKLAWAVTYKGGYVLPNATAWTPDPYGPRTLPYDLERAALELIKTTFLNRGMDGSIKVYKTGETQVQWNRSAQEGNSPTFGMPSMAAQILSKYKRAW